MPASDKPEPASGRLEPASDKPPSDKPELASDRPKPAFVGLGLAGWGPWGAQLHVQTYGHTDRWRNRFFLYY